MISKDQTQHLDSFTRASKLSEELVRRLVPLLGEVDASSAVILGGVESLRPQIGDARASEYLRDLADRMESNTPPRLQ